jgi:hypothetical protein
VLHEAFPKGGAANTPAAKLVTSRVDNRNDIFESLRTFFKAGR